MTSWQEYFLEKGHAPDWPYPIRYDQEQEIESDILVIGGGIAGCWAAISAARQGLKVGLITGVTRLLIRNPMSIRMSGLSA
jgi:NADPH-dependent 2,4-dienoyl-CoA reductase/sulfur reductase-like enzyme